MKSPVVIYTDGGSRGNPGPAAIGVYIADNSGKEIVKFGKTIGETTNNVAEYRAVIEALQWVKSSYQLSVTSCQVFLDSQLVVNQLNGVFKIKEQHLRDLIYKIKDLEKEIGVEISYQYIPREQNKIADSLVNQALDTSL